VTAVEAVREGARPVSNAPSSANEWRTVAGCRRTGLSTRWGRTVGPHPVRGAVDDDTMAGARRRMRFGRPGMCAIPLV